MRVVAVACLKDNYAYVVVCDDVQAFFVVDPSESEPVLRATLPLQSRGFEPLAILSTHHHWDHVGGNEELAKAWSVPVFGSVYDQREKRIPAQTRGVSAGDTFEVGSVDVSCLEVPGHTLGAVAYVCRPRASVASEPAAVFTGDTLFVAGAGRIFEGTPSMMHASLSKLAALPPASLIYCGHEYTESNLRYAKTLEPLENSAIEARAAWAAELRRRGEPTVPSTIEEERRTNPFLRVHASELRAALGVDAAMPDDEVLGRVRARKDAFRA